jgi:hypothetical protein
MNYLTHLKRNKQHYSNRWVVKYDDNNLIREVKLVYNPDEYRNVKNARKLHTQQGLIKILENDRKKRNS